MSKDGEALPSGGTSDVGIDSFFFLTSPPLPILRLERVFVPKIVLPLAPPAYTQTALLICRSISLSSAPFQYIDLMSACPLRERRM